MCDCISEALSLYGLENARVTLLRHNENRIRGKANRRYLDAYFALAVLLFVCCQYTRAGEWIDWFPAALERRQETIFDPLSSGSLIPCIL